MNAQTISLSLGILGVIGIVALLVGTGLVIWHYRGSRIGSFRWRWRAWRLTQLSAIACFFFLAMAASYAILQEAWGWLYVTAAFTAGTWWVRYAISRRV